MKRHPADERRWAVARIEAGDPVTTVAARLGRSRPWVYRWLTRAQDGESTWAQDRSPSSPIASAERAPRQPSIRRCSGSVGTSRCHRSLGTCQVIFTIRIGRSFHLCSLGEPPPP